jgi:peptidoglycan/LPS O-acetylase OafA/YrhL
VDGLRALAALAVVAYHYWDPWTYYGMMGVELFFVISGFVILMTVERGRSLPAFAFARIARLYPAYWLSVAIVGLFLLATDQAGLRSVIWNATMIQRFLQLPDLIDPYWTLAYELWFYAVVALIVAAGQLHNVDRIALAWLILMSVWRGAVLFLDQGGRLYGDPTLQLLLMPQFGHLFIAGMMLYRLDTGRRGWATRAALMLAIAYSLFGRPDWAQIPPAIYFFANAAFIAAVWAAATDRLPLLAGGPIVALGACSYSLYLLHVPIDLILSHAFGTLREAPWFHAAIVLPIAIAAALLSRAWIEAPSQVWARRKLRSRADG